MQTSNKKKDIINPSRSLEKDGLKISTKIFVKPNNASGAIIRPPTDR